MTPDITRSTFQPEHHYTSVRLQQGRLLLDADWNEQADMLAHFGQQHLRDVVGLSGAPKGTGAFLLTVLDDGTVQDLAVQPGHFYVDGLLCELDAAPLRVLAFEAAQQVQLETLQAGGRPLAQNHWVRLSDGVTEHTARIETVDGLTLTLATDEDLEVLYGGATVTLRRLVTYATQPHYPLPDDGSEDLATLFDNPESSFVAYLDVWERPVSGVEDSALLDEALGGADTTTRFQRVWQLRLAETEAATCADLDAGWQPADTERGRLRAQAQATADATNICIIPAEGGYRRLENQLYRVEVHTGGAPDTATFVWSRDNAARAARVEEVDGVTVRVVAPGRDVLTGLTTQWIELTDTARLLRGEPGHLARVNDVNGHELTLDAAVAAGLFHPDTHLTLIRRWDSDDAQTLTAGAFLDLEDGVQVEFDQGTYTTGDYWLIPARTATGRILWPIEGDTPLFQPRHGIDHAFAPLALLSGSFDGGEGEDGGVTAFDCRIEFPPLTNIDAADVGYDDTACGLGASTVQEAIEVLCSERQGHCTLTLTPGTGWADALTNLPAGSDVQLCFQTGDYPVEAPVVLSGLGAVKVSGGGPGTRLLAPTAETVLRFEACTSVLVRDLYVEAGALGHTGTANALNGALTFYGCGSVHVEAVTARCASGAERAATCLTIDSVQHLDGDANTGIVRVRHCDLRVGHQQVGLLVLNARRTHIEDNVVRVGRKPPGFKVEQLLENRHYRAGVRRLLITRGRPTDDEEFVGGIPDNLVVFTVNTGEQSFSVTFETDPMLQGVWEQFNTWRTPSGIQSSRELYWHLRNMADRVLTNRGNLPVGGSTFTSFNSWYQGLRSSNAAVAAQGIVVAGRRGREVRILDNTIHGVLQGVHLALDNASRTPAEQFGTVRISGNTINVFLSPFARSRHGIYVSHCDSLLVEDNYVRVRRYVITQHLAVAGLSVSGVLGCRCAIVHNHVVSAAPAIAINAHAASATGGLRTIRENVFENGLGDDMIDTRGGVIFRTENNENC